jgi:hypothetical protein
MGMGPEQVIERCAVAELLLLTPCAAATLPLHPTARSSAAAAVSMEREESGRAEEEKQRENKKIKATAYQFLQQLQRCNEEDE